jgi:hypothetical protein
MNCGSIKRQVERLNLLNELFKILHRRKNFKMCLLNGSAEGKVFSLHQKEIFTTIKKIIDAFEDLNNALKLLYYRLIFF